MREIGAGLVVLLIHGTGCDSDFWGAAAERLAQKCRVVIYDRRGTSRSAALPTADHAVHASDAAALIRQMNVGPVLVLGWSMGGIVALCLVQRHPELVRGLILQEPPLYAKGDTGFDVLRGIVPVVLRAKLGMKVRAAEAFNRWTYSSGGTGYDQWPEAWKLATRQNASTICAEIEFGTGEQVLTPPQVQAIQHPVLGLVGQLSLPYYRRAMSRLGQLMPQLRVRELAGGNHAMHVDARDAWVEAVSGEL